MISNILNLFFDLIKISIGNRDGFHQFPTDKALQQLYDIACKQSLASVLLEGIKKTDVKQKGILTKQLLLEWIGTQQSTISMNRRYNERAKELTKIFAEGGFRSCVLKGQGTALYYEHPEYRQCGDIDIWVEGDRDIILDFLKKNNYRIDSIDIKHTEVHIFDDVPVEVHFLPSWMYCPPINKRLMHFFEEEANRQFANYDERTGFTHTTLEFDLVYSMVHIYRHIFSEGIGLRQLMDYYYILQNSSAVQRAQAFEVLCGLRMKSFVGGIMWILQECFGMKKEFLLCPVNVKHGEFLLSEILTAGNFGHYDDRMKRIDHNRRFARGIVQFKKNLRFVGYYPSEVLWSPFWKLWHWGWRKLKGYL